MTGQAAGAAPAQVPPAERRHVLDLTLLSAAHAVTHVQPVVYPLVFPFAMQALGFGFPQIGLLLAVSNLVSGLLQGVHGWLSRWVKRKTLCGSGNILLGASMAISGLASNFAVFTGGRVLGGVAASPQHPVAASLMSDWYRRKGRGSAFSVHFSGGNVGTLVGPLLAGFLLPHLGWRATLMVFGLPGVAIGALVWIFLDDRRAAGELGAQPARPAQGRSRYLAAVRRPNVLLLVLARAITSGGRGIGIVLTFVPLYLIGVVKLSTQQTGFFVSLLALGSVVGPVLAGRIADRVGRKQVVIASLLTAAVATVGLIAAGRGFAAVLVALLLMGIAVYNESPLTQAMVADVSPPDEREGAFSVYFVVSYVAGALWAGGMGLIVPRFGFTAVFALMVASYVVSAFVLLFVRQGGRPASPANA